MMLPIFVARRIDKTSPVIVQFHFLSMTEFTPTVGAYDLLVVDPWRLAEASGQHQSIPIVR